MTNDRVLLMERLSALNTYKIFAVAIVYAVLALLLTTGLGINFIYVTWPLSGLVLAILLMGGTIYAVSVLLGSLFFLYWQGFSVTIIMGIAIARSVEAFVGCYWLTRATAFDQQMQALRDFGYLLLAGFLGSGVGALIAVITLLISGQFLAESVVIDFLAWWLRDSLGILLFTPLLLVWRQTNCEWFKSIFALELLILIGLAFLAGQVMYFDWFQDHLGFVSHGYVMYLFVTWAAVRYGIQGVSLLLAMVALQSLLSGISGRGHFAHTQFDNPLVDYWMYLLVLNVVGIVLAVYFNERKRVLNELKVAAVAFEAQQGMLITDAEGVVVRINHAFTDTTGFTQDDLNLQPKWLFNSEKHNADFYQSLWKTVVTTGKWQGEIWIRYKNGSQNLQWLTLTEVKSMRGIVTHYVGTLVDIAARKAAEEAVYQLAFYDSLTNLPNRRMLLERLKYDIEVVLREGKQLALMMLDLDRFKQVNDTYGHAAGDELLIQVGDRLNDRLRDVDLVARLGGDEFVVLLGSITMPEDAAHVATEIVADLSRPFKLSQSDDVRIGVSIGISLFPQHGESPEMLLEQADRALYQAKNEGRGCFAYFSEQFTQEVRERIALENRLRIALQSEALSVVYQPQVDISSSKIVGAQMLVRWYDKTEGLISPSRFIPVAEESGLIAQIGEWVMREGCRQARQWLDEGLPRLRLSVKLSSYQIHHGDINAVVADILKRTGFPAECLELEFPESSLCEHDGSAEVLQRLRGQGVKLVIDDFGTGNVSLSYLQRFPLDVLKIGRVLIEEQGAMKVAATIVAVAKSLKIKTLAEGVETTEQLDFLEAEGCDTYQGYYKSHPVSATEFVALLKI